MNSKFFRKEYFFLLMISLSTLAMPVQGQIGNLGIYGSVPEAKRANARYVRIEPNDTEDPIGYTIPVNGLKNFNFYYLWTGLGFLPGQHYTITYLDANESSLGTEIVNYTPNGGYTNGTQAATPFNIPPGYETTPRGLHGRVYGNIGGVNYLFPNARIVTVPTLQTVSVEVRTNGNGEFFAYYQNGNAKKFLPVHPTILHEHYGLIITGSLNGCTFSRFLNLEAEWEPYNSIYPDQETYFTTGAETDVGDLVLPEATVQIDYVV